jgi:sugar fermentation stimulation protein A
MLFLVQIGSAERFALAADIDPAYANAFVRARAAGVEAIAYRCVITADGIDCARAVPIEETTPPIGLPARRARLRAGRPA